MTFDELIASRRAWIDETLIPWCKAASFAELRLAEIQWTDLAGRAEAADSLWPWAWSRFPALIDDAFQRINETQEVDVTLRDGTVVGGFPDARASTNGKLVLIGRDPIGGEVIEHGPFSIDAIADVSLR